MYELWIANSSGAKIAQVKNLVPLDGSTVLEFSEYLSSWGTLRFRIQTKDPLASEGYFTPYQYHIKLYRYKKLVWSGVIVNNPRRNHKYIEVEAFTYAWLLTRIPVSIPSLDKERTFNSGTMAAAVTTLFNEGKAISNSPISTYTLGTIENPKYPWDTATEWTFTDTYTMNFYFQNLFTVISSFADITNSDWEVTADKVFNFKIHIGQERPDISLRYGKGGNVDDYNSPLDGRNYCNELVVLSRNETGASVIKSEQADSASFATNGRLWSTISLDEEIAQNILNSKAKNIFAMNKSIDNEISVVLNNKAMPLGTYTLGDKISIIIDDGPVQFNQMRRVVGWRCSVSNTMTEHATIITNNLV